MEDTLLKTEAENHQMTNSSLVTIDDIVGKLQELKNILSEATEKKIELETLLLDSEGKNNSIENILKQATTVKSNIDNFYNETFNSLKDKIQNPDTGLEATLSKAHEICVETEVVKNASSAIKAEVEKIKNQSEEKLVTLTEKSIQIEKLYNEYIVANEQTELSKKQEIDDFYTEIRKQSENLSKIVSRTEDFERATFGDTNTEGLSQRLATLEKQIGLEKSKWADSYEALYAKIEGLLPGATSAGLARAYDVEKEKYRWPYYIWASIFCATMLGMIFYAVMTVHDANTITEAFIKLLGRAPFFVPAIWLAIFASKQQSQNRRLEQEYVNKATVAKTYEGHRREIQTLPNNAVRDVLTEELLRTMVENVKNNPSNTLKDLSHNDAPPFSIPGLVKNPLERKSE